MVWKSGLTRVCRHPAGVDGMDLDGEDEEMLSIARG